MEEDGEGQVEVEREEGEGQGETHMDDYADGMRLKNTLSHEVRVTQTSRKTKTARSKCRAHWLCNLRVSVFVYLMLM